MGTVVDRREVRGMSGIRKLLALGVNMLAALMLFPLLLSPSPASASTLTDCLAQQHVCVASDGRGSNRPVSRYAGTTSFALVAAMNRQIGSPARFAIRPAVRLPKLPLGVENTTSPTRPGSPI